MLHALMMLVPLCAAELDLRSISRDERIRFVNRVANRLAEDNAFEHYDAANGAFVPLFKLTMKHMGAADEGDYRHVERLAEQWTDAEARVIEEWLSDGDLVFWPPVLPAVTRE